MTSISQKDAKPAETQVRAVKRPQVLPLSLPHRVDAASARSSSCAYHCLSRCLRANVFPGAPLTWRSLCKDSYISHPPAAGPTDPRLWYGHKTDDVVQWTERNIMNQKLDKTLREMRKKSNTK